MANFDNYTNYVDNAGISGVVFGAGSTVLEVELNEMQEIQAHYLRELTKSVIGDGITDISKLTYSDGKVKIADGCNIICNGYIIKADKLELSAVTGDTIYLWVYENIADHKATLRVEGNHNHPNNIKNWIMDNRAGNETTRRKIITYQLQKIIPPPVMTKYSYIPIAKIVGNQMIKLVNEVNFNKLPGYIGDDVYGVEVDWENNTSIRLSGSVGKMGGTDHDNIIAFNRRKCIVADDGNVLAYYGDSAYTESGKLTKTVSVGTSFYAVGNNVQVMVEQNKFYYKVVPLKLDKITNGIGYKIRKARYYISDTPKDGFKVHPAFIRNGVEVDKIYIASYKACIYDTSASTYIRDDSITININEDRLASISSVKPTSGLDRGLTRDNMRVLASHIGEGWQLKDFTIMNMDILLFLVEYATLNIQNIVGYGYTHQEANTGMNYANNTGTTADLGNNTGMYNGINGLSSITYRGEEDIFGSLWENIDGINIRRHDGYWSNDEFTDNIDVSPYKPCGFSITTSDGYITAFGYSEKCDFAFIPAETSANNINEDNAIGDYAWVRDTTNWRTLVYGGTWDNKLMCGLCAFNSYPTSASSNYNVGGRIVCIPPVISSGGLED